MRKKLFGKNFSRSRKARLAMYRSLTRALVLNGKISTTLEKAKVLKVYFEKQLTVAKRGTVAARRKLLANLGNAREVADEIVRLGTLSVYLKVTPLPSRKGDAAKMARVEVTGWVAKEEKKVEKKEKVKKVEKAKPEKEVKKVEKKTSTKKVKK
jgi:large subunit ribosomal protein L17